jgi:hypothetical protein
MTAEQAAQFVWVNANSHRASRKLPISAVAYSEWRDNNLFKSRYVYAIPAADFDARILGGGYHGKISKARVNPAWLHKCWA